MEDCPDDELTKQQFVDMYNKIFPALQQFLGEQLYEDQEVDLPIPVIFASSFKGDGLHDFLVTENLRATNYFQVKHSMGDTNILH